MSKEILLYFLLGSYVSLLSYDIAVVPPIVNLLPWMPSFLENNNHNKINNARNQNRLQVDLSSPTLYLPLDKKVSNSSNNGGRCIGSVVPQLPAPVNGGEEALVSSGG
jgi:hypothetical protein